MSQKLDAAYITYEYNYNNLKLYINLYNLRQGGNVFVSVRLSVRKHDYAKRYKRFFETLYN